MVRNAEARLPERFLPLDDANRRSVRAFCRGAAIFGVLGLGLGFLIGWAA